MYDSITVTNDGSVQFADYVVRTLRVQVVCCVYICTAYICVYVELSLATLVPNSRDQQRKIIWLPKNKKAWKATLH